MRILRLAYSVLIAYACVLAYLTAVATLHRDYGIALPLGTITTTYDLIPFPWLGLTGAILTNFYRMYSKRRLKPKTN
ncbi:MAG TPA: hypothetical protein VNA15_02830 [Candidatus Angelobacter sp.]|nr:hypothetical protein [Candidatus Angelobacter sp.]